MAQYAAKTLVIPFKGETANKLVLRNKSTGDLIHATTGAVTDTWAEAVITGIKHADSNDWTFAIPPVAVRGLSISIFDASSTTKDSVPDVNQIYDALTGVTYTDTNANRNGKLF
jgi:hypothetical protein